MPPSGWPGSSRATWGHARRHSVSGKAWVNQVLESNPVPVIWVTNRIEQIDPAFRRRFQHHLEPKSPPPGAREALIQKVLGEPPVSPDFTHKLAQRNSLTPAQIRTASRFAQLVQGEALSEEATQQLIERQLRHADSALGCKARPRTVPARRPRPVLLNVQSQYPVPRIVQALARTGRGSLVFYGPPGTW